MIYYVLKCYRNGRNISNMKFTNEKEAFEKYNVFNNNKKYFNCRFELIEIKETILKN